MSLWRERHGNGDPAAWVAIGLQFLFCCHEGRGQLFDFPTRRRGREAEGGGLLNRWQTYFCAFPVQAALLISMFSAQLFTR
jgi:hypothetical protein